MILPKDTFHLYYMVRNYRAGGPEDVAARWSLVRDLECAGNALQILRDDFATADSMGPKRVAEFLEAPDDEELASDVVGFVGSLISLVDAGGPREDEVRAE